MPAACCGQRSSSELNTLPSDDLMVVPCYVWKSSDTAQREAFEAKVAELEREEKELEQEEEQEDPWWWGWWN